MQFNGINNQMQCFAINCMGNDTVYKKHLNRLLW
jgi:hypothetical protein